MKMGFTLAEVLITLGIIGVVAAMTMPSLIQNNRKKVFAAKVKQTYALVSNALLTSVSENGAPSTWDYGEKANNDGSTIVNNPKHIKKMAKQYFVPYFKNIKEGENTENYYIILNNGTVLSFNTDGVTSGDGIYTPNTLYITASFNNNTSSYYDTSRDYSKKDVIMFVNINEENARVRFFNWADNNRDSIKNNSIYACNKNIAQNKRYQCGALIQIDNWEIRNDYPW